MCALAGVWLTVRQKRQADARKDWWAMAEWATGLAFDEDASKAAVGLAVITQLMTSPLATDAEVNVLRTAALAWLPDEADTEDDDLERRLS